MSKKQEVRELWANVLKTNRYRQADSTLKETVNGRAKHCCLGVLCELYIKEHPQADGWDRDLDDWTFQGEGSIPPMSVLNWAGLTTGQADVLATWNDDDRLTFKQIAAKLPELPINGHYGASTQQDAKKGRKWANQYGSGIIK